MFALDTVLFSIIPLGVVAVVFAGLSLPAVKRNRTWRATVTPLASIIGSGFLVAAPLLVREVGDAALLAVLLLCAAAYFIGGAVRFNILHVEPLLEHAHGPRLVVSLEALSRLALSLAYFVSVAFYLLLFASFVLKWLGHPDDFLAQVIATGLLVVIGFAGSRGGLTAVERLEIDAVSLKLAIIAGLVVALAVFTASGQNGAVRIDHGGLVHGAAPAVLGMLIITQGFETSRYMGEEYDRATRVRTMRIAQLTATAIYAVFFVLVVPMLSETMEQDGVAAILDVAAVVSPILPTIVTIGALASQFSAATADSIGAAGLMHDISHGRISGRHTYPFVALVSIVITWTTDVFGVVALASRAFALYYMLQCLVAITAARVDKSVPRRPLRDIRHALLAALCLAVVLFGTPVEGG